SMFNIQWSFSNPYKNLPLPHLALPHLCAFTLAPAGPILQPDVPAMPATDHLAHLHDALAQRKAQMWTEILYSVDAIVPPEQSDVQSIGFNRMPDAFARQLRQACHANPLVSHTSSRHS